MRRRLARFSEPRVQFGFWIGWTLFWLLMDPVTMLTALRSSVPWLEEMSLFANVASCGTAAVASLAYIRAASADEKATHVIEHHPAIPPMPDRSTAVSD